MRGRLLEFLESFVEGLLVHVGDAEVVMARGLDDGISVRGGCRRGSKNSQRSKRESTQEKNWLQLLHGMIRLAYLITHSTITQPYHHMKSSLLVHPKSHVIPNSFSCEGPYDGMKFICCRRGPHSRLLRSGFHLSQGPSVFAALNVGMTWLWGWDDF